MIKISWVLFLVGIAHTAFAQRIEKIINKKEVRRIEEVLSSDNMEGRRAFTPAIDRAADFIAGEFRKAGLKPVSGDSYFQDFSMIRARPRSIKATINGKELDSRQVILLSQQPELKASQQSGYELAHIGATDNLFREINRLMAEGKNYLVLVDTGQRRFSGMRRFRQQAFPYSQSLILIQTAEDPQNWSLEASQTISEAKLKNVVGMIPGKSRPGEYVIFSAHYDHLGIGKPNAEGDSIYNGANDDAAGTTGVIMLANYFAHRHDNERTLIFAAFTAEEMGGYGSQYFSRQFDPSRVMAMFNIEMIGTESKWGTNSAYITGYDKTDMGSILEKNLKGTGFNFYPDPYPSQNLFYRSDNATLARQGVPAHTISTSKMDSEKYYHTQDDEIGTLDMKNMARIIRAIALSSGTIVSGQDTPTRVDTSSLR